MVTLTGTNNRCPIPCVFIQLMHLSFLYNPDMVHAHFWYNCRLGDPHIVVIKWRNKMQLIPSFSQTACNTCSLFRHSGPLICSYTNILLKTGTGLRLRIREICQSCSSTAASFNTMNILQRDLRLFYYYRSIEPWGQTPITAVQHCILDKRIKVTTVNSQSQQQACHFEKKCTRLFSTWHTFYTWVTER